MSVEVLDDSLLDRLADIGIPCSGIQEVSRWTGLPNGPREECTREAEWIRTTWCCIVKTTFKCDQHKQKIDRILWTCTCGTSYKPNENTEWRRL